LRECASLALAPSQSLDRDSADASGFGLLRMIEFLTEGVNR
jgi:hypothetical protein